MSIESKTSDKPSTSRRQLFAAGGTVGALAAVAAVLPSTQAAAPAPKATVGEAKDGEGYRLTAHVLRYYETTRI